MWALADEDGVLPDMRQLAWSEYTRNTLANCATQFPDHWAGTISVDDVCFAWYGTNPAQSGNGLSTNYDGQITGQPTWIVMDAIRVAGIAPQADGYLVTPHLPMRTFPLRLPEVGVVASPGMLRGYVTPQQGGVLRMQVTAPGGSRRVVAFADGRRVRATTSGSDVMFELPTRAGRAGDWAVVRG
jgi:hypothetical protein